MELTREVVRKTAKVESVRAIVPVARCVAGAIAQRTTEGGVVIARHGCVRARCTDPVSDFFVGKGCMQRGRLVDTAMARDYMVLGVSRCRRMRRAERRTKSIGEWLIGEVE